jgi:penicillin-binding protein 1A
MRRGGLVFAVAVLTVATWTAAAWIAAVSRLIVRELDRAGAALEIAPRPQATRVFDRSSRVAFSFFIEERTDVPLDQVSRHMVEAILAVEDRRFHEHHGVDPIRIAGAAWRNFRAGRIVQGASTITQQLARASQLSPVRTYERKFREILLAARLEERYSKSRILEAYLNTVYFGDGHYGVEAAARGYFGKSAADLDLPDAALLAALVRSPSTDAPGTSPARATKRRNLVLRLMREQDRITDAELATALAADLPPASHRKASAEAGAGRSGLYFEEEIRRQLLHL